MSTVKFLFSGHLLKVPTDRRVPTRGGPSLRDRASSSPVFSLQGLDSGLLLVVKSSQHFSQTLFLFIFFFLKEEEEEEGKIYLPVLSSGQIPSAQFLRKWNKRQLCAFEHWKIVGGIGLGLWMNACCDCWWRLCKPHLSQRRRYLVCGNTVFSAVEYMCEKFARPCNFRL